MGSTKAVLEWNQLVVKRVETQASETGRVLALWLRDMIKESMGTTGFPKIQTGKLKESISAKKIKNDLFEVSTDVSYASYVEFGTSRSAPYPYFRPNISRLKAVAKGGIV